jgi:adsorption protein B
VALHVDSQRQQAAQPAALAQRPAAGQPAVPAGWFVTRYYGIFEGLLSAPRMMWSNFVNFFANLRALRQVMEMGDSRRVAWDKTTHEFPALATPAHAAGPSPGGKGLITEQQLEQAITSPVRRRLGRELLLRGWLTSEQLVQTLAEQLDLPWAPLNPFKLDRADRQAAAQAGHPLRRVAGRRRRRHPGAGQRSPVSQVSLG